MRLTCILCFALALHFATASIEFVPFANRRRSTARSAPLSDDSFSSSHDRFSTDSAGTSSAGTPSSIIGSTVKKLDERADLRFRQANRNDKQQQIMSDLQRGMAELQKEIQDIEIFIEEDPADLYTSRYRSWISFDEARQTIKDYYKVIRPVKKSIKDIMRREGEWEEFKDIVYNLLQSLERIIPIGGDLAEGSHDRNAPKYFDRGLKKISQEIARLSLLVDRILDDEDDDDD
jgi:hypothetical protein